MPGRNLINGSWDQTQVLLLDEILTELKRLPSDINVNVNPPEVNVSVNPPEVNVDVSLFNESLISLSNKIDNIKPVIVIEKKNYEPKIEFGFKREVKRRIGYIKVNDKPVLDIDTSEWVIVHPSEITTGYIESVFYNYTGYKVLSNKLFWLVKDKIVRTILIKKPKNNKEQYYKEAFEEAKMFGLDLTDYYKNLVKI